jgi:hypothetical protein
LEPGKYVFRFEFKLPANSLPSWNREIAKMVCEVKARAVIRRDIDAVKESSILVIQPTRMPADDRLRFASEATRELEGHPRITLDVEKREIPVGGTIAGRLVVSGTGSARLRDVDLRLIERVWAIAKGHENVTTRVLAKVSVPAPLSDSESIPFSLTAPDDATPSVTGRITSLRHLIRARVDVAGRRDVRAEGEVTILARKR